MGITVAEFGFTIVCQITGACLYAAIFGNIAQLLAKLDAPGARYRAQRDKIDEFVSFHEVAPPRQNQRRPEWRPRGSREPLAAVGS